MNLGKTGKKCFFAIVAWILTGTFSGEGNAAEKILFIPLDNRPVSLEYTADSFRKAGVEVCTPPISLLASDQKSGDPEGLLQWLDQEAPGSSGAVVASDSVIYGGLVNSRTHELPEAILQKRAQQLLTFKQKHPLVPLYVFGTVMRSPKWSSAPAEPTYYVQYGPQIFQWGVLRDKKELGLLKKKEVQQLVEMERAIPETIRQDVLSRRDKNRNVLQVIAEGILEGKLDYFLIGRDDSAPYSEAHRDARHLLAELDTVPAYKIRSFSGTDELGMVLLNRALNKARGTVPLVYGFYGRGVGKATVPSYEDGPIGQSYREHVLAAGGYPAQSAKWADLVLGINTRQDGTTPGADTNLNTDTLDPTTKDFLDQAASYLRQKKNVGIADIAFGNGGSNALMKELFHRQQQYEMGSYAGWNTAGNSLGYALGQGLLRPYLPEADRKTLLEIRYLDDWIYQSKVRQALRRNVIYPHQWPDGKLTEEETAAAEAYLTPAMKKAAAPYLKNDVENYTYRLPWHRTFEIQVSENKKEK